MEVLLIVTLGLAGLAGLHAYHWYRVRTVRIAYQYTDGTRCFERRCSLKEAYKEADAVLKNGGALHATIVDRRTRDRFDVALLS
jgi:hypothetical protein